MYGSGARNVAGTTTAVLRNQIRMEVQMMKFSVKCPQCGNEVLAALPVGELADELVNRKPIRLYSVCHDTSWYASAAEIQQLHDQLSALSRPHKGGS